MIYALPLDMLTNIIKEAVSIGEHKKAQELGEEPRFISQRKAYRLYTETSVDRWIENGIIKKYTDSDGKRSSSRFSVLELEAAAYSSNIMENMTPLAKAEMVELITQKTVKP